MENNNNNISNETNLEYLLNIPIEQLLQISTKYLSDSETATDCTFRLLERIRLSNDNRKEIHSILQIISLFCVPSAALSEQMMELCFILENVEDVVEVSFSFSSFFF